MSLLAAASLILASSEFGMRIWIEVVGSPCPKGRPAPGRLPPCWDLSVNLLLLSHIVSNDRDFANCDRTSIALGAGATVAINNGIVVATLSDAKYFSVK